MAKGFRGAGSAGPRTLGRSAATPLLRWRFFGTRLSRHIPRRRSRRWPERALECLLSPVLPPHPRPWRRRTRRRRFARGRLHRQQVCGESTRTSRCRLLARPSPACRCVSVALLAHQALSPDAMLVGAASCMSRLSRACECGAPCSHKTAFGNEEGAVWGSDADSCSLLTTGQAIEQTPCGPWLIETVEPCDHDIDGDGNRWRMVNAFELISESAHMHSCRTLWRAPHHRLLRAPHHLLPIWFHRRLFSHPSPLTSHPDP